MKFKLLLILLIVLISSFLRFRNYEGRTNYGFDQSRDVKVIETYDSSRVLPLLGPIVRGDIGGFYLGPLYHYLLIPIYNLAGHNPLSLVYLSIILDILVAVALVVAISPVAGIVWATSSLLINSSLTPWNVSLIHPWVLLSIYLMRDLYRAWSFKKLLLLLLMLGSASSIHLTLFPLVGVYLLFLLPVIWRSTKSLWHYLLYFFAIAIPQIPLVLSDLSHSLSNLRAFKDFLFIHSDSNTTSMGSFMTVFVQKLGFTVSRLFVGEPYLVFGILMTGLVILYAAKHYKSNLYIRYSLITIFVIFLSLFIYRDLDFAEYYLSAALLPIVVIFAYFLESFKKIWLITILLVVLAVLNYRSLNFETGPYSMRAKRELVADVAEIAKPGVDLHLLLNEHQQFGFDYYLRKQGNPVDSGRSLKLYIAPSDIVHISSPSEAQSIIYQTTRSAFKLVVFSN